MEALIRDVVRRRVGHAAPSSSHGCGGVVSAGFCISATTVLDDRGVVVRRGRRWPTGGLIVAAIWVGGVRRLKSATYLRAMPLTPLQGLAVPAGRVRRDVIGAL